MRHTYIFAAILASSPLVVRSQVLMDITAAQAGADTLAGAQGAPAGGQLALDRARAVAAPGAVGGVPNPSGGLAPPPALGAPVAAPAPATAAFPGLGQAQPGAAVQPGVAGAATPTPIPTIRVLTGQRVFDAVTNALLEDPAYVDVKQSEQENYADDGIRDNGIQNDGVRGDVKTIKDQFIGAETNSIKNRLINLVRNAENLSPMVFFGYHVMAVDPTTQHRDMPNLLVKEAQRDELLRDWNARFLADFRTDKTDPRSGYFQLYVPEPPRMPRFPMPPGYTSPQKQAEGQAASGVGGTVGGVPAPAAAPATAITPVQGGPEPSIDTI